MKIVLQRDAQPKPMSSSKDLREISSKVVESALLVAQVKLPRVFEIRPLDMCRLASGLGSFQFSSPRVALLAINSHRL